MKSLDSKYTSTIVPQLLNLLMLGVEFSQSSLQSIVEVALSVQTLGTTVERTRGILKSFHSNFCQELEMLETELSNRMAASHEMIEAFKEVSA